MSSTCVLRFPNYRAFCLGWRIWKCIEVIPRPEKREASSAKYLTLAKAHGKRSKDYDNQWRVLSERFRAFNPLCADCEIHQRSEPATEVHHIIPIEQAPSRRLDQDNLVALCTACHKARHRRLNLGYDQDDFSV